MSIEKCWDTAFDLLFAGVDAHAKNHSILHVGGSSRLAPAYDLISAHGIWSAERIKFTSAAAVQYAKERPYRKITGRNLARAADVLRMPRPHFVERIDHLATRLPGGVGGAISELPPGLVTEQVAQMPDRIGAFAREFVDRAHAEDLSQQAVATYQGAAAIGGLHTRRVWEAGQWKGDRWITGRYRTRAGR